MKPILYSSTNCPHSSKASFFLAEKGLQFERIEVNLGLKINKTPEYLAINPRGSVPAYEDEQGVIGDSLELMRHVDSLTDGPRLFPQDPQALQDVLDWIHRADHDFWDVSHHLYWQIQEPPADGTDWDEVARLKAKGRALLQMLEDRLSQHAFVCGDFSAADIALAPWVHAFRRYDLPAEGEFPQVTAWRDALTNRPAFVENFNKAGYPLMDFLAAAHKG